VLLETIQLLWDFRFSQWRVIWEVASCVLAEIDQRFRGAYCLHRPDDRGSMLLWNVGKVLPTTRRNMPEDSNLHSTVVFFNFLPPIYCHAELWSGSKTLMQDYEALCCNVSSKKFAAFVKVVYFYVKLHGGLASSFMFIINELLEMWNFVGRKIVIICTNSLWNFLFMLKFTNMATVRNLGVRPKFNIVGHCRSTGG
jgi:hypothetical protein